MRDPYLYPEFDTLKNKLGIKNQKDLDSFEEDIVPIRIMALRKEGMTIKSVYDIKAIHKYLFSSLFEWAGEYRTITMYKREPILDGYSVDYTPHEYIAKEMNDLEKKYQAIDWKSLDSKSKVKTISSIVQELWQIHCFREGNTRSVALFLYFLIKTVGLHINVDYLGKNAKYFRNSLVLASLYSASKPEYLQGIIADCTTVKNVSTNKYETINGYEVEKYTYTNHTTEKIKTIKGQ